MAHSQGGDQLKRVGRRQLIGMVVANVRFNIWREGGYSDAQNDGNKSNNTPFPPQGNYIITSFNPTVSKSGLLLYIRHS